MKKLLLTILFLFFAQSLFAQYPIRDDAGEFQFIDKTTGDFVTVDITNKTFTISGVTAVFKLNTLTTVER
ncbi:hypothetical protein LCGC14_2068060, partial [marine sediment metagenome]